jgi:AcrR family transcriptional regulator
MQPTDQQGGDEQSDLDTRSRLIAAALEAFTSAGYDGVSVREIERKAGVNRGLVAYHFGTREVLWQEAVNWLMDRFHDEFQPYQHALREVSAGERQRVLLMVFTRFCAKHPEYFRLLLGEGAADSDRSRWLIEHLRRHQNFYNRLGDPNEALEEEVEAISTFAFTGGAATIFAVPTLCQSLFGIRAKDERTETLMVHVMARVGMLLPGLIEEVTNELEKRGAVAERNPATPLTVSTERS